MYLVIRDLVQLHHRLPFVELQRRGAEVFKPGFANTGATGSGGGGKQMPTMLAAVARAFRALWAKGADGAGLGTTLISN